MRKDKIVWEKNTLDLQYVPLTKDMFKKAEEDDKNFYKLKNGLHGFMSENCNIIGSLAQQAVAKQFEIWKFKPINSPFFDDKVKSDKYDFMWRGEKCDVKGSEMGKGWHDIYPNSVLMIESDEKIPHKIKGIQRYVFVGIDLEDKMAIICGQIKYEDFWRIGKNARESGFKVKKATTYIRAKEAGSFRKFVYSV